MNRVAFITGVTGQDGAYLARKLLGQGVKVVGGFRRGDAMKTWRLKELGIADKIDLVDSQLNEPQGFYSILNDYKPTEIYHLAADSLVADSFKHPSSTLEANIIGTAGLLEAIRVVRPEAKVFFASSSEVFGNKAESPVCSEDTNCFPNNPYGLSKLSLQHLVRIYSDTHGLNASTGILFNHESPLRGRSFVTRKITYNVARIKHGLDESPIRLGNLDSARDWGHAEDYCEAMMMLASGNVTGDFVIASGIPTSVRDFLRWSCLAAGFDPSFEGVGVDEKCYDNKSGKVLAEISKKYFRPTDTKLLIGDASKIQKITGWAPKKSVEQIVQEMVETDIERHIKGEQYV